MTRGKKSRHQNLTMYLLMNSFPPSFWGKEFRRDLYKQLQHTILKSEGGKKLNLHTSMRAFKW